MKPIIFNAIDKLYNEKTGMIVPVSAAVGGNGPQPEPTQKFTLNKVLIDGPYSGGPFSNVYNCHFDMAFNETPPADCEDGYGGYHSYAVITGVCGADETGVIKDTGNYQINGIVPEYDHPDEYQYQSGDPAYPYGQTFGPATLTITDNDGNVWGTATTDDVTFQTIDNL